MIVGDNPCFPHNHQHGFHLYGFMEDFTHMLDHPPLLPPATTSASAALELETSAHVSGTLIYNLSVLRSKVEQVDAMVNIMATSPNHALQPATAGAASILQEIIVAASSMMLALEQLGCAGGSTAGGDQQLHHRQEEVLDTEPQRPPSPSVDVVVHVDRPYNEGFFGDHDNPLPASGSTEDDHDTNHKLHGAAFTEVAKVEPSLDDGYSYGGSCVDRLHQQKPGPSASSSAGNISTMCDVIELNAADLLAKYTHYCQICGKGFKRDANLRMHMRAHGDEYKTAAALSKGIPQGGGGGRQLADQELAVSQTPLPQRKYSCPQEGCRWNKGHARFQPLKSMICVKNHYRRSHCPKMYVCNRCNKKRFSVLSDLRTHEKHCGDLKWRCSCGTTFSRKDKLMGHVALFAGHAPADCHQLLDIQKQRQQQ